MYTVIRLPPKSRSRMFNYPQKKSPLCSFVDNLLTSIPDHDNHGLSLWICLFKTFIWMEFYNMLPSVPGFLLLIILLLRLSMMLNVEVIQSFRWLRSNTLYGCNTISYPFTTDGRWVASSFWPLQVKLLQVFMYRFYLHTNLLDALCA